MSIEKLKDVETKVERMADGLGWPIDEHIKPLVIAMNYAGFETRASCEGHLDQGCPYPWVDVGYPDPPFREKISGYLLLRRMKSLIKEFNNMEKPSRPFFVVPFVSFRLQQFPEFYEDEPIVSKQELRAMQADTKKLAEFLIQKTEA